MRKRERKRYTLPNSLYDIILFLYMYDKQRQTTTATIDKYIYNLCILYISFFKMPII